MMGSTFVRGRPLMARVSGRLAYLVFILLVVTFLVSAMLELMPGEPTYAILGEGATPEQIASLRERLRLDEPLVERYMSWARSALTGDLGNSLRGNTPVLELIVERAPVTLQLVIGSQVLALLFAIPAGLYSAYRPGRHVDNATTTFAFAMISIPHFVLGLFLVLIFSVHLGWFPVSGFTPLTADLGENLRSMVLPTIAVAAGPAAIYQRLLRSDMAATLREDYIAMAEAKGLTTARILLRHAFRPSTFSLVTLVGLTTAQALGGSVVVEVVFGLPGVGRLLIGAIELRDLVLVQGIVTIIAVGYVLINGLVDVMYGVLDPRVRRGVR